MNKIEVVGDFDKFFTRAKNVLELDGFAVDIRKMIGTEMANVFSTDERLKDALVKLFKNKIPCDYLPPKFKTDFNIFRNKGSGDLNRTIVYWYYLHSRAYHEPQPAENVDKVAFLLRSKNDPDEYLPATYEEKFGEPVFTILDNNSSENSKPDDARCKWKLLKPDETENVKLHMYDLTCDLKPTNETTETPAKLLFYPFLETREIEGLNFGFKQAVIDTSLNTKETDADITFNSLYENGVESDDAVLVKNKPRHRGKWTLKRGGVPLDNEYSFEPEVATISFSEWELSFSVEYRIDQFSLYVCYADGSKIEQDNKRTILKILVGEHQLAEYGGDVDLLLVKKDYCLKKVDIYGA